MLLCSRDQANVAQKQSPPIRELCHAMDFEQMWPKHYVPLVGGLITQRTSANHGPKVCPLLEDFIMQQTLAKCGPKKYLLLEDFITQRALTKLGPKLCPSSEDFIMQRTLTKCGLRMCPSLEDFVTLWTLTKCGIKNVLLVGRLCPNANPSCKWAQTNKQYPLH
jgi:hypothetical protein